MIYDSIKQWFLRLIAEEQKQKQPALVPISPGPQPHAEVEVNGDCPACHEPKAMREIYQRALRCQACGWQNSFPLPPGISRSQLETFQYPDAAHRRKFRQSFNEALTRIVRPRP